MLDKHRKKKDNFENSTLGPQLVVGEWVTDSHLAIGESLLHDIIVYIFAH